MSTYVLTFVMSALCPLGTFYLYVVRGQISDFFRYVYKQQSYFSQIKVWKIEISGCIAVNYEILFFGLKKNIAIHLKKIFL